MSETETDPRNRTKDGTPASGMIIYEIINPSDTVTFEADDVRIAMLACGFVGDGRLGLRDEKGEDAGMPFFLAGGCAEWLEAQGIMPMARTAEGSAKLADALDSFICCSVANRKAIRAAVGNDPAAMARFNEEKRSSLNNICGRARKLAAAVRKSVEVSRAR